MTSGVADPARSGKCSCKHKFLVFTSLTTVFLFSGTVFGWGAFSSMLTQEGYYDFLCPAPYDKRRPCEMQMQALNSAFTWATTCVSLFAFVNGWLVDVLGPTKVTIISGVMNCVGLMGIALTKALPWSRHEAAEGGFDLFFWSLLLVAVGGSMTMFIGYQAPFLVPSKFTLLIEVNSCLFDAGTIIFPVLKLIYDVGVPFSVFFWIYTVVGMICFSLLAIAWTMNSAELDRLRSGDDAPPSSSNSMHNQGMLAQLKSWEFAAIFIYSIIQVPRANMYMGSVDLLNSKIAERQGGFGPKTIASVSTITGFIIPFGFLVVPLIEWCVHSYGTIGTVQITTALGILYNAMQLIPVLYLQLGTTVIFAAWRAFLYSTISAFNGEIFGVKTMGRIMGLCFVFSGLTNLLTAPLVNAAVESTSFIPPPVAAGLGFCIPLPFIFWCLQKRRARFNLDIARESFVGALSPEREAHHKEILDPVGAMSITRARSLTWPGEVRNENDYPAATDATTATTATTSMTEMRPDIEAAAPEGSPHLRDATGVPPGQRQNAFFSNWWRHRA